MDLKEIKGKNISIYKYLKKYNCRIIVNNRIKRLKTTNQILEKNSFFFLKKDSKNFLYIISLVFLLVKKIWSTITDAFVKNLNYKNQN